MAEPNFEDTIAAIATPVGQGAIAVLRVSGKEAFDIVSKIFRMPQKTKLHSLLSHTIHLGEIYDGQGQVIDQVLACIFRSPNSYTAEDVIEINCHGGTGVTRRILDLLIRNGARHAQPGEFTKRAFLNGKMDLTQAEAVVDLIKAQSDKSLEVAVHQLKGFLSRKFNSLKEELVLLYAHMEAFIDFPEEDLEIYSNQQILSRLSGLQNEIGQLIASFRRGAIFREGLIAVIVGKPNVGKSSLFNALLERDRALVSEFPGTTRDHLEELISINGVAIRLVDTAGLQPVADHPLDQMGMVKTRHSLSQGQLFLYLVDGSAPLDEADRLVFGEIREKKPALVLINKCDQGVRCDLEELEAFTQEKDPVLISAHTREGLEELEKRVGQIILDKGLENQGEQITRLRHKNALEFSLETLRRAEKAFCRKESLEFIVADLKLALDQLRELVGEVYSEDLLDVIFREFCIGK